MIQTECGIVARVAHFIRFGITCVAEKPRGAEGFWMERSGARRARRRVEPPIQHISWSGWTLNALAAKWPVNRAFRRRQADAAWPERSGGNCASGLIREGL